MSGAAIASERPAIRPESADSLRAETSQIGHVKTTEVAREPCDAALPLHQLWDVAVKC